MNLIDSSLLRLLSIPDSMTECVSEKAQEIYNISKIRIPEGTLKVKGLSLLSFCKEAEVCRHVFSIHLACERLCIAVDCKTCAKVSYSKEKTYNEYRMKFKTEMESQSVPMESTLDKWGLQYDIANFLDWYTKKINNNPQKESQWFIGAAFTVFLSDAKIPIDKSFTQYFNKSCYIQAREAFLKVLPDYKLYKETQKKSINNKRYKHSTTIPIKEKEKHMNLSIGESHSLNPGNEHTVESSTHSINSIGDRDEASSGMRSGLFTDTNENKETPKKKKYRLPNKEPGGQRITNHSRHSKRLISNIEEKHVTEQEPMEKKNNEEYIRKHKLRELYYLWKEELREEMKREGKFTYVSMS